MDDLLLMNSESQNELFFLHLKIIEKMKKKRREVSESLNNENHIVNSCTVRILDKNICTFRKEPLYILLRIHVLKHHLCNAKDFLVGSLDLFKTREAFQLNSPSFRNYKWTLRIPLRILLKIP